jgi:hypothetical protein
MKPDLFNPSDRKAFVSDYCVLRDIMTIIYQ